MGSTNRKRAPSPWSRRLRWLGVLAVGLVTVGILWFGSLGSDDAEALDIPLAYIDGSSGNLSDFRGAPVVLNFWASWCPACVAEMPDFQSVHEEFGDAVTFIGVNVQEIDRAAADALIAETGVEYRLADDPRGDMYQGFGAIGMPTTVFISAAGSVVDVHPGAIFAEELSERIRDLLDAS